MQTAALFRDCDELARVTERQRAQKRSVHNAENGRVCPTPSANLAIAIAANPGFRRITRKELRKVLADRRFAASEEAGNSTLSIRLRVRSRKTGVQRRTTERLSIDPFRPQLSQLTGCSRLRIRAWAYGLPRMPLGRLLPRVSLHMPCAQNLRLRQWPC
jgi:hypothetical protein